MLALRVNDAAIVKSVGDCRAYLLRNNSLRQLTHDHTLSQMLAGSGQIATCLPGGRREVLLNSLGVHDFHPNDEFSCFDLQRGDRILLTNRGLTSYLSQGEILPMLATAATASQAAAIHGREAVKRGGANVCSVAIFAR